MSLYATQTAGYSTACECRQHGICSGEYLQTVRTRRGNHAYLRECCCPCHALDLKGIRL